MTRRVRAVCAALALLVSAPAAAHSFRPATAWITERAPGELELRVLGGDDLRPRLERCAVRELAPRAWTAHCPLGEVQVGIDGLGTAAAPDAILRIERADGSVSSHVVGPGQTFTLDGAAATTRPSGYLALGAEHLFAGADHLALVVVLVLSLAGRSTGALKRTAGALTAFTAGHTLTLAAAALGVMALPAAPVEALIALSVVLLAADALRRLRDRAPPSRAVRLGVVAGGVGLVHGLGFAGALVDVGLPREGTVAALLGFNVGLELAQLAVALLVWPLASRLATAPYLIRRIPPFAIGALAAAWTVERVSALVGP